MAFVLILCVLFGSQGRAANASNTSLSVIYNVLPDNHYKLYGYLVHHIDLKINGTVSHTDSPIVVTLFVPFTFDRVTNLPAGGNYSIQSFNPIPSLLESKLEIKIPPSSNPFTFDVIGSIYGDFGFAYRNVADIPYVYVSMNVSPFVPTSYYVSMPQNGDVQTYSVYPGGIPTANVNSNGVSYLVIDSSISQGWITVQYQPAFRDYFVFLYLLGIVAGVLFLPRLIFMRISLIHLQRLQRAARRIFAIAKSIDSKKLFTLFMLLSVVMVSAAFVFGPSPSPKVYLAATPTTSKILGPRIGQAGYSYLTVGEAGDEFDTMAALGTFSAVVVADYPPPLISGLQSMRNIIVVQDYASQAYVTELKALYPTTVVVRNSNEVTSLLSSLPPRQNPLGLSVDPRVYTVVLGLEGLLSIVLPFVALAFFSRFLVESRASLTVRIGEAVGFSFFCFMFGQLVFMSSSLYLGLPVGLHAAISNAETAVGVFGFGGGTRPRELAGALGIFFGLVSGRAGRIKLDIITIVGIAGAVLFLLIDPLRLGDSFYNSVLAQTTSVSVGTGAQSVGAARSFIGIAMDFFGSAYNVSLTYYAQHGAAFFYFGAVPLALYAGLKKSTATTLALFASFVSGLGFVRIADMLPTKAIASVVPGVALGVGVSLLFLGMNYFEAGMKKRMLKSA